MAISSTREIPVTGAIPTHVAIVMDGNGRWAHARLLPRTAGHAKGVQSVKDVQLIFKSISETTQQDLLEADAIIVGTPVYNANVAPEVVKFMSEWPFSGNPLKNKIGAAFVTAGGLSAGEELAQVNLLHTMLVFGMIIVGGDDWTAPFGASAITSEGLYNSSPKLDTLFIHKGYALGKRVAEITKKLR